jgi:hypothetical protein
MKYKIHNRIFMDASYSFSMLEFYYDHIIASLRKSSKDFLEHADQLENSFRSKQKEFNKQEWLKHYDVYSEVYPGFFNNSFVMTACSLFEYQIKRICTLIKEEHKVPFDWDVMIGNVPTKTKRFLNFAGVTLKDDPPRIELSPPSFIPTEVPDENRIIINILWNEIENYFMVRNCIAHHNGLIQKARTPDKIKKYATEKRIFINKAGQLELLLNDDYNREICNTMEKFIQRLEIAYYSTPLPK